MSWYLSILPSDQAAFAETAKLTGFLATFPELRQKSPVSFGQAPGYPWTDIVLVQAKDGDFASDLTFIPVFNCVAIVGSSQGPNYEFYKRLAGRIAEFLGWIALDEEDGSQVWPPA